MRIWQNWLGYIFACDTDGKVFFLLQGVSNSGKSVLLELLRSMFNPEAVSTLDLYRLGDRFSGAALIEKKLNICGDLPNRTLSAQAVATLKQITGRDLMTVEEKYKPLATMAPAINLVFASNFPIRMAEEDTALLSRMVVIPFRFSIPTEQQDHLLTQKILADRTASFSAQSTHITVCLRTSTSLQDRPSSINCYPSPMHRLCPKTRISLHF